MTAISGFLTLLRGRGGEGEGKERGTGGTATPLRTFLYPPLLWGIIQQRVYQYSVFTMSTSLSFVVFTKKLTNFGSFVSRCGVYVRMQNRVVNAFTLGFKYARQANVSRQQ